MPLKSLQEPRLLALAPALIIAVLAILYLSIPGRSFSAKKIPPHVKTDIAQSWIGISEDELDVMRLDLHPDGKGWGSYVFVAHRPQVFQIAAWSLERYSLEIRGDLKGLEDKANGALTGAVIGFKMELTMSGDGWHRKFILRPENDIESRLNALRRSMDTAARGVASSLGPR
jgi:hypothetical protein